jgi:hypothetical protein
MLIRSSFTAIAALTVLACGAEDSESSEPAGSSPDTAEVADELSTWQTRRRRTWSSATSGSTSTGTLQTRTTADGETIQVVVPTPAPIVEVPEGGTCGVFNAEGALLSCQAGTFCLTTAEGAPGTCVSAPRAPISDG